MKVNSLVPDDDYGDVEVNVGSEVYPHLFFTNRCEYCNRDENDIGLYGPEFCTVSEGRVAVWSFGPDSELSGKADEIFQEQAEEDKEWEDYLDEVSAEVQAKNEAR